MIQFWVTAIGGVIVFAIVLVLKVKDLHYMFTTRKFKITKIHSAEENLNNKLVKL
jgi:hypothetical protein